MKVNKAQQQETPRATAAFPRSSLTEQHSLAVDYRMDRPNFLPMGI